MQANDPRHVHYILLAEFDIDRGSVLSHQYPNDTGTSEHLLAELMLPDGAHRTEQDWTVFFLNQRVPSFTQSIPDGVVEDGSKEERPPLLYVLNLVRNKHDPEARRGARVKAMAIASVHRFVHIYKPVLLFALDKYFQEGSVQVLATLYAAVNAMDLSAMPKLSHLERQILRSSEDREMFDEKFQSTELWANVTDAKSPSPLSPSVESETGTQYAEGIVPSTERRNTYIDLTSGERRQSLNRSKDRHFFDACIVYDRIKLPIRVPLTLNPEEVGDFSVIKLITIFTPTSPQPFQHPYHPHLDSVGPNTPPIILLLNALITQKRIIFSGHGHPSGEVANCVLAACALGSGGGGVLRGFPARAFPYTNLTHVDTLLKFPGFIAGVTNPTFEEHPKWWDVLCNISTGKITVSPNVAPAEIKSNYTTAGTSGGEAEDVEFMNEIMTAIQSHLGEQAVRAKFQQYLHRFVRIAAVYEEEITGRTDIGMTVCNNGNPKVGSGQSATFAAIALGAGWVVPEDAGARQKELAANAGRVEGWQGTISYKYFQMDFHRFIKERTIKDVDVHRQISKLRAMRSMPEVETTVIFDAFVHGIVTPDQIIEFLSFLPQNQGGLYPIALGLFHPSKRVRRDCIELFERLKTHPTGVRFVRHLNRFQRLALERLSQARTARETTKSMGKLSVVTRDSVDGK